MAKKQKKDLLQTYPFFKYLHLYYLENKSFIRKKYKPITRKFLDYNDPGPKGNDAWLRPPQFEALEMYVFLKEYLNNKLLYEIFQDYFKKENEFEGRSSSGFSSSGDLSLFSEMEEMDADVYNGIFKIFEEFKQEYPNYIYALTMGLGKTVLMATSIFYEFLLANKYPKDERFCHNALVFAPDKTVLYSLKEITTLDKSLIVPPEYVNFLEVHLQFHFLDDTSTSLNVIEKSKFNIIITNNQKIILKKKHKTKTATDNLFSANKDTYKVKSADENLEDDFSDLYTENEGELLTNQRFTKLLRLQQLGVYIDEAHHAFGNTLAKNLLRKSKTSLRLTVDELAANLKEAGTRVVGCYNYTGTPYVNNKLLPEIVYSYGLKNAILNKYLKQVNVSDYTNTKSKEFVRIAIKDFWKKQENKRYEGMLPKIALFASNINELQTELRPAVEDVLIELGISTDKVLVNVGDNKITSNDDIREFKNLDTVRSNKQFILLVNKGKEGWNCRSLFGVALHRQPKSKIFVLQATMRCLRSIGDVQNIGNVYLSSDNKRILEKELQEHFKLSIKDISSNEEGKSVVRVIPKIPIEKIKIKKVKKLFKIKEKQIAKKVDLLLSEAPIDGYKIIQSTEKISSVGESTSRIKEDVSINRYKREFSSLTLVAEISRYLNRSCIEIKEILTNSTEGLDCLLGMVNEYNELIYDWVIPKLFNEFYTLEEYKSEEEIEVELVKMPTNPGYYEVKGKNELIASSEDVKYLPFLEKTFHLDNYVFDSNPENDFFWRLINNEKVKQVFFTGMLTHGQTEFNINYIDPESHTVRTYYPDFLVKHNDGSYTIYEVKGDNKIDDEVVLAKAQYAKQMAVASGMKYEMVKGSEVNSLIL